MERYDADPAVAKPRRSVLTWQPIHSGNSTARGRRTRGDRVNRFFQKNGHTIIVDPHTAGKQLILCSCPSGTRTINLAVSVQDQWSWIGGLVGPTNPTWHLEIRDFLILPQYSYDVDALSSISQLSHGIGPLNGFGAPKRNASIGVK